MCVCRNVEFRTNTELWSVKIWLLVLHNAVKEDKSLNGFIKAGHRELIPLAEFRTWLMSIRDVDKYREKKHRDGTVYADKHGNKGYGPFLPGKQEKLYALRNLLNTESYQL